MPWTIRFAGDFEPEFDALPTLVQDKALATFGVLEHFGPSLGRPRVDTSKGSRHANMKELRFSVGKEEWRVAFAFDPAREAIILVAGDKAGENQKRFYDRLIAVADARFDTHLTRLEEGR